MACQKKDYLARELDAFEYREVDDDIRQQEAHGHVPRGHSGVGKARALVHLKHSSSAPENTRINTHE